MAAMGVGCAVCGREYTCRLGPGGSSEAGGAGTRAVAVGWGGGPAELGGTCRQGRRGDMRVRKGGGEGHFQVTVRREQACSRLGGGRVPALGSEGARGGRAEEAAV